MTIERHQIRKAVAGLRGRRAAIFSQAEIQAAEIDREMEGIQAQCEHAARDHQMGVDLFWREYCRDCGKELGYSFPGAAIA